MLKKLLPSFNRISTKVFLSIIAALIMTMLLTVIVMSSLHKEISKKSMEQTAADITVYLEDEISQRIQSLSSKDNKVTNEVINKLVRESLEGVEFYPYIGMVVRNNDLSGIAQKNMPIDWLKKEKIDKLLMPMEGRVNQEKNYQGKMLNDQKSKHDRQDSHGKMMKIHGKREVSYPLGDAALSINEKKNYTIYYFYLEKTKYGKSDKEKKGDSFPPFFKKFFEDILLPAGLTFIVLFGLVAFVFSYFLSRYITKPIKAINKNSKMFAKGNFSTRIDEPKLLQRKDELGSLAGDFNVMANDIELLFQRQENILRDISHELRSPLARMNLAVELLRDSTSKIFDRNSVEIINDNLSHQKLEKMYFRINKESQRMDELIGEIIHYVSLTKKINSQASSDNENNNIETIAFDFNHLIEEIVADVNFEYQKIDKQVNYDSEGELVIEARESELTKLLGNIINNAMFYTKENTIVNVSLNKDDQGIHLSIYDFGEGVPEELLESIFYPLFRVEKSRTRNSGGYGLGLAIAKRVVDSYEGKIIAKNNNHGGLSIYIDLPLSLLR